MVSWIKEIDAILKALTPLEACLPNSVFCNFAVIGTFSDMPGKL